MCAHVYDQDGGRLNLQLVSRGILELHVNSLTADDASNYTCSAVNDVGQSQRSAVVTVNCKLAPSVLLHLLSPHP